MTHSTHRRLATITAALLFVLHLDFWRPQRARLYAGWIPEELGWRLAWMALAFAWILYAGRFVWRPRPDPPEAPESVGAGGAPVPALGATDAADARGSSEGRP